MTRCRPLLAAFGLVAAVTLGWAPATHAAGFSAGSTATQEITAFKPEQVLAFAKQVERSMAQSGARVAILARMGRPVSEMPTGMRFTHVAFAVYSRIQTADGRQVPGYAIHNLYQVDGAPDRSVLTVDYPVDFFAGVAELEAGILIPSPELQQRLLKLIASPTYAQLHEPAYSVIANPYTTGRQNCTEFVLDVVNAAIYQQHDPRFLKQAAQQYFKAQAVDVNPFKLLLGAMFSKEVSTSDHQGQPVTATFERIADYLAQYDQGSRVLTLRP